MLQRTHLLLGLVLGILLMLSAASGLLLAGSSLQTQLQSLSAANDNVAQVAERIASQLPGIERIERAPGGELRVAFNDAGDSNEVLVDPATGAVLAPYEPSATLTWVRNLHRELLLGDAGRWLSALAALALLLLTASGAWLLARRLGGWRQLLLPIRPGKGLGHWHAVVARWVLPPLAVLSCSGLYLAAGSQGWINDGQDSEPAYPQAREAAPDAPLGSLPALRHIDLRDLRELEFPVDGTQDNFYTLRTASGDGFVNASSGQWISYQPHSTARRLYETAYELHSGANSPLWTLILGASSLAVLFLSVSGLLAWWQRRQLTGSLRGNVPAAQAEIVLLVGSQGGTTWSYARQLQTQLQAAGRRVHCASMNQLQAHYASATHLLLLTSTYGDGQAPESASEFLDRLARSPLNPELEVAVLAFGDSRFQHFCGYARQVEQALQERGLHTCLPLQCIDRGAQAELQQWAGQLGQQLGLDLQLSPEQRQPDLIQLRLLSKEVYDPQGETPAAILRFALPRTPGLFKRQPRFAPGDLLAIKPQGELSPRFYSIASSDDDEALEICVRKHVGGLCSSRLHELNVGDSVEGYLQPHPDFRPSAGRHPVILVGAGTGVAPLIGFVRKNAKQRPLHLYWGGRSAQTDFLYESELSEYLADGRLSQLSLAFSQSQTPQYVQDRLGQDAALLSKLFAEGAQVLVCGSKAMAAGVREVLDNLLLPLGCSVEQLRTQGRYREDVY